MATPFVSVARRAPRVRTVRISIAVATFTEKELGVDSKAMEGVAKRTPPLAATPGFGEHAVPVNGGQPALGQDGPLGPQLTPSSDVNEDVAIGVGLRV